MTESTEQQDSQNFRNLREKVERLERENGELRGIAARNMIQVAGYDPGHKLTGLVLDQYLANEEADLSPASFATFATDYDLPTGNRGEDEGASSGPDNSDAFNELQAGADSLRSATRQADAAPSEAERVAKAEAEGNYQESLSLKANGIRNAILSSRQ